MRVLVVGSGGREHALVWKLAQSPGINALFCAPGNGGISRIASCVDIQAADVDRLLGFAKKEKVNLVVVGPENALAAGIVDTFEGAGIPAFGPRKIGSQIETSKVFAKTLMDKYGIPTAKFRRFEAFDDALAYIKGLATPYVIKADGLCAGKGAYIIKEPVEGEAVLREVLIQRVHGDAGREIIVESFLPGVETSYLVFADGTTIVPMLPSQDHKALLDNDQGPNTGGMGAYTPVPFVDGEMEGDIDSSIMKKTIDALRSEGITYKGVLYGGLMLEGRRPYVLEFNARFGDPETQPILFKMESDLLPIVSACAEGTLNSIGPIKWKQGVSLCVVIASRGYPEKPEKGKKIKGLEELDGQKDVFVFHAGTARQGDVYYTSGGRVLGVTVLGDTYADAIGKAYNAVSHIQFEGMYYRKDIGKKALGA
ncbi:MAG: Phosphoribosylamine--glycine ligase [Syntrophorhabdaceae bacterium PtaU1.Bin034]|nr:MAG: Phosphoribosylamine--glycine ligase [Syntrophorhabdaceae bacterium PtaU1.Bin034]